MKRDVVIDLTSLLDVILILLFIIMVGSSTKAETAAAETDSLRSQISEADSRVEQAESGLSEARDTLDQQKQQLEEQSQLLEEYSSLEEYTGLQGSALAQYQTFDEQVAKLDLRCQNVTGGCDLTLTGADGTIRRMTIPGDADRAKTTAQLAKILSAAIDDAGDGVLVLAVRYNNFQIHMFEYNIISDAVAVAREGLGSRLLYAEVSQTNP